MNRYGILLFALLLMIIPPALGQESDFFGDYFIKPLVTGTGYNIVNTMTFAIILIAAAFLVYRLVKKMGIIIDKNFLIGVIPFVALGGIMRAWEDFSEATGIARNFLFVSPLIYITIFLIALCLLIFSVILQKLGKKKIRYYKVWFITGAIIDIYFLAQLRFSDSFAFLIVLGISIIWAILFLVAKFIARRRLPKLNSFLSDENMFIILVHMFDATTTFVALQYLGYWEQHVVPTFVISVLGAWSMFLLKIIVVPVVLFFFDKELKQEKEKEMKTFLKLVVLILGLGPGLRNWLRMIGGF